MKGKKKVIIILILLVVILLLCLFFIKNNDKTMKFGNTTINKTTEGISEYILNMSSYDAKMELTITSNKNSNKYVIHQQYVSPNITKQTILDPANIKDLTTTYDGKNLTIENTKLSLSTMYEDYPYLAENQLFLSAFVEDYKNTSDSKVEERDGTIIMQTKVKNESNKYMITKKLYIDKNTANPVKMEVQDNNQNTTVYILYNEIKINSTKQEEIIT